MLPAILFRWLWPRLRRVSCLAALAFSDFASGVDGFTSIFVRLCFGSGLRHRATYIALMAGFVSSCITAYLFGGYRLAFGPVWWTASWRLKSCFLKKKMKKINRFEFKWSHSHQAKLKFRHSFFGRRLGSTDYTRFLAISTRIEALQR